MNLLLSKQMNILNLCQGFNKTIFLTLYREKASFFQTLKRYCFIVDRSVLLT